MSNFIVRIIAIIIVSLAGIYSLEAQWIRTNGPCGGKDVLCFSSDGARLFAGTGTGVYVSADSGMHWACIGPDAPFTGVYSVISTGTTILAGTQGGGIFRSTDDGLNWSVSSWPIGYVCSFGANAPTGSTATKLFAASRSAIYASTDAGNSWTSSNTGIPFGSYMLSFVYTESGLFAGTQSGIFRSTDDGVNWIAAGLTGISIPSLAVRPKSAGSGVQLIAGTASGVYLSDDYGSNWSKISSSLPSQSITSVSATGSDIIAICAGNIYRSSDGGTTWIAANTGGQYIPAQSLHAYGPRLFVGAARNGAFLSTDRGDTWSPANAGLGFARTQAMTVAGTGLYAATKYGGLFVSSDDGVQWSPINNGLTANEFYAILASPGNPPTSPVMNLYAGGAEGVFLSTDMGGHWTKINDALLMMGSVHSLAAIDSSIFAGSVNRGIYRSTNMGSAWTVSTSGMTSTTTNALAVIGSDLFAGGGGLSCSSDYGTNWTAADNGLAGYTILCLLGNGSDLYAGTSNGLFISSNGGLNWGSINNGLKNTNVLSLAANGADIYAGTQGGVFLSKNNGGTWSDVTTGLGYPSIYSLSVHDGFLFAGSDSGVWKRPLSEMVTGIDNSSEGSPSGFVLEQNYPNPFNPSTTIRYRLPAGAHVTLAVYDVLGREVAVLANEKQSEGLHTVNFSAADLPNGVYFCRLLAGNQSVTKKLTILK